MLNIMPKTFIGVRDVDTKTFQRFRTRSTAERLKIGDALNKAMLLWLQHPSKPKKRKGFTLRPFDWGPGTERTSMEIDTILYGK